MAENQTENKKNHDGPRKGISMLLAATVIATGATLAVMWNEQPLTEKMTYEEYRQIFKPQFTKDYFEPKVDPLIFAEENAPGTRAGEILQDQERESAIKVMIQRQYIPDTNWYNECDEKLIAAQLSSDTTIDKYLNQPYKLREDLTTRLNDEDHTYRVQDSIGITVYDESTKDIKSFTFGQLLRIHLVLEALKDQKFVDEIGRIVQRDLDYPYSEFGGIVTFKEGQVHFEQMYSSVDTADLVENNGSYMLPARGFIEPQIGSFHLHATQTDDSKYAGPSGGMVIAGDESVCLIKAALYSESHQFVITSISNTEFNIDYYGANTIASDEMRMHVLDLGNYTYNLPKTNNQGL